MSITKAYMDTSLEGPLSVFIETTDSLDDVAQPNYINQQMFGGALNKYDRAYVKNYSISSIPYKFKVDILEDETIILKPADWLEFIAPDLDPAHRI